MIDISAFFKTRSKKAGMAPGTLMHVGERLEEQVTINRLDYAAGFCHRSTPATIDECLEVEKRGDIVWINIDGLHDVSVIEKLGSRFAIDHLSLEDILNTAQRPKLEDSGHYLLIVIKMLYFSEESGRVEVEQISIVLGSDFVLTFQESRGDVFGSVRERLLMGRGRIRKMGADYLVYAILDSVVDHYFIVLERLGEEISALEEKIVVNPTNDTLQALHQLRRELIFLGKSTWPMREVVSGLERSESNLVSEGLSRYLRDLYDHTVQIIDIIETYKDLVQGMMDLYMTSLSNKMNEIMKVLTVFASIFIPLTFVAGIYGMNFEHMPELSVPWAYPLLLFLMFLGAMAMLFFYRRKGWW